MIDLKDKRGLTWAFLISIGTAVLGVIISIDHPEFTPTSVIFSSVVVFGAILILPILAELNIWLDDLRAKREGRLK